MYQDDSQSFYQQIYAHINWQTEKINQLEQRIQQLEERDIEPQQVPTYQLEQRIQQLQHEMNLLKNQRPVIVEKMEYKFDQLKVEKLEGTLNIGVTPHSLGSIDELTLHDKTEEDISIQPQTSRLFHGIKKDMEHYLQREFPKEIHGLQRKYKYKLDEEARLFVMEDINEQMDNRIHYYLNEINSQAAGSTREPAKEAIVRKVRRDIRAAVENYISKLSKEENGFS